MQLTEIEVKNYLNHFPKKISKELVDYVTNEVLLSSRYIFTHRVKKQQYGYCTHCKKEFETKGLKHNEKELCLKCKRLCIVKASGRGRKQMIDRGYLTWYEKSVLDPKVIVARGIYVIRDYRGDYREVETEFHNEVWYIFDMKSGPVMFRECTWWGNWVHRKRGYERIENAHCYFYKFNQSYMDYVGYSRESIREAVKDTPYSWSGWEHYEHKDMVEFFTLYTRYPCIEYLTKLGFSNLVRGKLEGDRTYSAINWRGKSLFNVLKIDKKNLTEINELKRKGIEINITFVFLRILQMSKKNKWNLSIEEAIEITENYEYFFDEFKTVAQYTTGRKITTYIDKQRKKDIKHLNSKTQILTTWRDYIEDCIKLQKDLTKENVLFPKNIYTAHQNTIKLVKIKENEEFNKKIQGRSKKLKNLKFEYKNLMIRPAESSLELIEEGKALNHCVGNYAERYAKGETVILFIRKINEPNKPYFTVEVRENMVTQVRGKRNCSPNDEVKEFMEAFKEEKLSKKSKKNRVKIAIPA